MAEKIEVFFCYALEDENLRLKLEKHLSVLKRQGIINLWHDQNIRGGDNRKSEIERHLNAAHVVLLLISPDFMASDSCFNIEVNQAMERYSRGETCVIPIILRPVDWQGAPFGNLQALPTNGLPVTTWSNPDEALFNVAKGIKSVIGELIACMQSRSIALFGYEMQGGRASPLWTDPSVFLLDETYEAWLCTKRNFSSNEIDGQTWVKTSNPEHTFIVHFVPGGTFREHSLSDPGNQWQGSWEVLDGILRLRVNKYEIDIFAHRESPVYSGVEFEKDVKEPHSFFTCFPLSNSNAKHWDMNMVPGLIERIFDQILHQRVEADILITYGALLCRGEMSIRNIVKILGCSGKYKERFINLKKADEIVERLYATFLGRGVDANRKRLHIKELQTRGSNVIIADLIDSEEYQRKFGEDTFPPKSAYFKPADMLKQLRLS